MFVYSEDDESKMTAITEQLAMFVESINWQHIRNREGQLTVLFYSEINIFVYLFILRVMINRQNVINIISMIIFNYILYLQNRMQTLPF